MPEGPDNQGLALPQMVPTVSPAAAAIRRDAIRESLGSYEIPAKPKSILDQNKLECCVSCALGSAMEMLNPRWPALAPLFHYRVSRFEVIGGSDSKGFLLLDKALETLSTIGICTHALHSYGHDADGLAKPPSDDAREDARKRALGFDPVAFRSRYLQVGGLSTVLWIREQLRSDHPVVIGIQLPTTYPRTFLNGAFQWLFPDMSLRSTVGHCVLVTGYDDSQGCLHIQDSHGKGAFLRGCWWLGYNIVDSQLFLGGYSLVP